MATNPLEDVSTVGKHDTDLTTAALPRVPPAECAVGKTTGPNSGPVLENLCKVAPRKHTIAQSHTVVATTTEAAAKAEGAMTTMLAAHQDILPW